MSKKMKTFIMVCGIVIGAGILLSLAGWILGGVNGLSGVEDKIHWISFGGGDEENRTVNLEKFRSIDLECDTADVEFIESDKFAAELTYDKKSGQPEVAVRNKTLTVADSGRRDRWFNFDIFGRDYVKTKITIYYPKNTTFHNVNVQNDMGAVELGGLTAKSIDVQVDTGYLEMNAIRADRLKVNVDMGGAEGSDLMVKGAELSVDTGSLELSGRFTGNTKVDCDMGSVVLDTDLPRESYSIEAVCDLGDCTVDGRSVEENYTSEHADAKNKLTVEVDSGSAEINFD